MGTVLLEDGGTNDGRWISGMARAGLSSREQPWGLAHSLQAAVDCRPLRDHPLHRYRHVHRRPHRTATLAELNRPNPGRDRRSAGGRVGKEGGSPVSIGWSAGRYYIKKRVASKK